MKKIPYKIEITEFRQSAPDFNYESIVTMYLGPFNTLIKISPKGIVKDGCPDRQKLARAMDAERSKAVKRLKRFAKKEIKEGRF